MSWLSKVSDLAGKAEDYLNKLDQTTGDVITQARSTSAGPQRSNSYVTLKNQPSQDGEYHTEELGRSGPSLPSRTHSEFAGGVPTGRKKQNENFLPSTSIVMEKERFDEFSLLNDDSVSIIPENETRSRRSSGRSAVSVATAHSISSEQPDVKSQLWAKDSQIAAMKSKLNELERRLERRSQEFYEMKAEKEMIEQRISQQVNPDSLEELQIARKKAQEQKDMLIEECSQMKRKMTTLEEEIRAMTDQLRLAKFNLNENKKEFDEYKDKAQKILQAKEKLIDSLKTEQGVGGGTDRPGHLLLAELEEMKVERDLARADLEAAQLQLYNLRSDMEELENQLREEQIQQSELRRTQMEERCSWQSSINLLNEKVECARMENGFIKQEMKRQSDDFTRRLEEKETQLRRSVEDQRARRREDEIRSDPTAGEKLMQKQVELEEALRMNQALSLRLERLQKSSRETSIPMEYPATSFSVAQNPTAQKAISVLDTLTFKFISMLRNYPTARIVVAAYFLLIHLWVFFIIITYTPEMHEHDNFSPSAPPS